MCSKSALFHAAVWLFATISAVLTVTSYTQVNQCPPGTKLWLLHLGNLELDDGWVIQGANSSTGDDPNPPHGRSELVLIAALIEHPTEGLILFDTGAGYDYPQVWGYPKNEIFEQVDYSPDQELPAAIAKTGHNISEVTAVIISHMHTDHIGGLEYFNGTDVPIWTHELELKYAYYSAVTQTDPGPYLLSSLQYTLNWHTFSTDASSIFELFPGINMRLAPGHTPGMTFMQVNLQDSGTWIFTSDMYHVAATYYQDLAQGWLLRSGPDWIRSNETIHSLAKQTNASLVFGHDGPTLFSYQQPPFAYT